MALADTGKAIGAVTQLLHDHLVARGFDVSVGRPDQAMAKNKNAKINVFLYEAAFDGHLRNHPLRDGEQAPLWLVLKYLATAFDAEESSDSIQAHELLGQGISALNDLNFVPLANNVEPLKLTFDETTPDLLSKIMQGSDEHYRLSVAFEMRPVMIMPGAEPYASLLVGVDYSTTPATIIGRDGVDIDIQPSLGPSLHRVRPVAFEAGERIEIQGDDLGGADLEVVLDRVVLAVVERGPNLLVATAEGSGGPIAAGTAISAGERPLVVRRRLSATRTRSSNLLAARLLPTVTDASIGGNDLVITGRLLGTDADDVVVAFYRNGRAVRLFDVVTTSADQQTLTVKDVTGVPDAVPAGQYRAILRVNNQQAKTSPMVTVS